VGPGGRLRPTRRSLDPGFTTDTLKKVLHTFLFHGIVVPLTDLATKGAATLLPN
jgi:hypothetical protein